MRSQWAFGVAIPLMSLTACGGTNHGLVDDLDGGSHGSDNDSTTALPSFSSGSGGGGGTFVSTSDGSIPVTDNSGPCKAGEYNGTFKGSYNTHLTGIGIPIPVTGNVDLTLHQAGTSGEQCMIEGELYEKCSDVFTLQNGTITGVADEVHIGDAGVGGFPYFCTMTGTLDCKQDKLDDGWIQCTYCVGRLADGGTACWLLNGVAGTTGVGGHFAGPLTANYDDGTLSFVMGNWNGAEALAGNDGGSPTPEGGPISDYLVLDGGYVGPKHFGGSGTWNATYIGDRDK